MTDSQYIFIWWSMFAVAGIVNIPLSRILFGKFLDKGYGLSKTLALISISYAVFLLSEVHLLPFTRLVIFLIFLVLAAVNAFIYIKQRSEVNKDLKKTLSVLIFEEILFAGGLSFWAFVRAHQPDINGLEKFMDYGFVNTLMKTDYLPPADMWFAGKAINYYWFGHYISALATKASGIPSYISYNLMLGTILGLALSGSFSIVSALIYNLNKIKRFAIVGGFITAILLNFGGNFHTPYYIMKNGLSTYWYPDATRFIGYNPDTNDKTIHEFPIYSYVVADLHAHLINFPFVLLYIALLYVLVLKQKNSRFIPPVLGVLLGCMFMANAWDFANYLLLSGFVILLANFRRHSFSFTTILDTAVSLVTIIIVALISTLPFTMKFESIAQGVDITHTKSPLWQLAILWGFPAVLTAVYSLTVYFKKKELKKEDVFVLALLFTGWTLIALPEFIYVKDIYVATHYRANTMFKLTYQAFIMFYLTSGYIAIRTIRGFKNIILKFITVLFFVVLFGSILYYPKLAVESYYGKLTDYRGLNGEDWLKIQHPEALAAIEWLRQNVKGQPVILEASGDSYTEYNSISAYTGLPTVNGWFVHEWLWRGSPDFPQGRINDIVEIYNSKDALETKDLLQKYNVKYVIIGLFEREKYPDLNEEKFSSIGRKVFTYGSTDIYEINY